MLKVINPRMFDDVAQSGIMDYNKMAALIQTQMAPDIIQGVISTSVVMRRAKKLANMTSNQTKIPVMDQLPNAYFPSNNNGKKKTTTMSVSPVNMYAEEMAAIAVFKEEAIKDALHTGLMKQIKERIVEAMAAKFDHVVITGEDKPDLWPEGLAAGCEAVGAVVEQGLSAYDDLLGVGGVISKVEESGYAPTAHLASISMKATLRSVKDNVGHPLFQRSLQESGQYDLDGLPITFAQNEAFTNSDILLITGDFSCLLYAIRDALEVKVFNTGNVTDAFGVEHNLLQEDKVAVRVTWRLGYCIVNPKNRLNQTGEAYPFAMLKKAQPEAPAQAKNLSDDYTEQQLSDMTIDKIKALAESRGYTITKSVKAEIIEEFLAQQDAQG